ncbi:MAG: hypothetical protein ACO4CU_04640 [Ilumatobacteraceae bacterium]
MLVLDTKDRFSKQRLFMDAWKRLYPDHLEWVGLSKGGKVTAVGRPGGPDGPTGRADRPGRSNELVDPAMSCFIGCQPMAVH